MSAQLLVGLYLTFGSRGLRELWRARGGASIPVPAAADADPGEAA